MNNYIVFRSVDLKEKFAYCIAPLDEVEGEECYVNSAAELVTDSTVRPFPMDGEERVTAIRDGFVSDREQAVRRAREAIADKRAHLNPLGLLVTEVPTS
jgi:hypothetical protein